MGSKMIAGATEFGMFSARSSSKLLRLELSSDSIAAFWSGAISTSAMTAASSIMAAVIFSSSAPAAME